METFVFGNLTITTRDETIFDSVCHLIPDCFCTTFCNQLICGKDCFVILCVVLALGGLTNGIIGGPLNALLDDSVEAGFRSDMEMYYGIIWNVASIVGPVGKCCWAWA